MTGQNFSASLTTTFPLPYADGLHPTCADPNRPGLLTDSGTDKF